MEIDPDPQVLRTQEHTQIKQALGLTRPGPDIYQLQDLERIFLLPYL